MWSEGQVALGQWGWRWEVPEGARVAGRARLRSWCPGWVCLHPSALPPRLCSFNSDLLGASVPSSTTGCWHPLCLQGAGAGECRRDPGALGGSAGPLGGLSRGSSAGLAGEERTGPGIRCGAGWGGLGSGSAAGRAGAGWTARRFLPAWGRPPLQGSHASSLPGAQLTWADTPAPAPGWALDTPTFHRGT